MATITDPEATTILDQLGRIQTQLANKADLSAVSTKASEIRSDLTTLTNEINALNNRLINAVATLGDLETRVRALESA